MQYGLSTQANSRSDPSVEQRATMLRDWLAMSDLMERVGSNVRGPIEAVACMSTVQMLHSRGSAIARRTATNFK